jgi:hypothetical protein
MLRATGGNVALADQITAEVEDSLWLVEHDAQVVRTLREYMPDHVKSYIDAYLYLEGLNPLRESVGPE